MNDELRIVITITMPKPKMNAVYLSNIIGIESFKQLKMVLSELGVEYTEMTCKIEKSDKMVTVMVYNPVLVVLHNEKTDRFHPAIFTEINNISGLPISPKFSNMLQGKISTYHRSSFDSFNDAVNMINDVLKHDVTNQVAVNDSIRWDGVEQPSMPVNLEKKGNKIFVVG